MLMINERRPAIRTLRGWAISALQEAGAAAQPRSRCCSRNATAAQSYLPPCRFASCDRG